MKRLLLFLLSIPMYAWGQADQSFSQILADKMKEVRPVVLIGPYTAPAYSVFLPIWTFHSIYDKDSAGKEVVDHYKDLLELGVGGKYESADRSKQAFVAFDVNVIALSSRFWDFQWGRDHVRRSKFPSIFLGPSVTMPLDWANYQKIDANQFFKANSRVMASVAITLGK